MFDVITFGSATKDIFLKAEQFTIGDFIPDPYKQKEICLPFGLKIDIDEIYFRSGGGGSNTAATFASQGLKTAYCGMVGKDEAGQDIIKELKKRGVETKFIYQTDKKPTNLSVIFSTPKERTILTYKGASNFLDLAKLPMAQLKKTSWFYLAPFGGELDKSFNSLVDFAEKNKIKLMVNLGTSQLKRADKQFLKKIDILLLNQEEGQMLVASPVLKEEKLMIEIKRFFPGILILTNGALRAFVQDKQRLYAVQPTETKVLDMTGAGDAFGSGFLSAFIKTKGDIKEAMQLAVANSAACIQQWGAKEGLLTKDEQFSKAIIHEL
jgi:sugar/nucleoside kinase (ribokinase family)